MSNEGIKIIAQNRKAHFNYFLSDFNKRWKKQKVNPAQYINVCVDANRFELLKFSELLEKTT